MFGEWRYYAYMTNTKEKQMDESIKRMIYPRMFDKMCQFCDDEWPDRAWDMALELCDELDIDSDEFADEIADNWHNWSNI